MVVKHEFSATKNNHIATLPTFYNEFEIKFEIKISRIQNSFNEHGWASIFHITSGWDHGNSGYRIPAVFLHKESFVNVYFSKRPPKRHINETKKERPTSMH